MQNESAPIYRFVPRGTMYDWCFEAVGKVGYKNAMLGNVKVSDIVDTSEAMAINDDTLSAGRFSEGLRVRLNIVEALSLTFLATYLCETETDGGEYLLGVDLDDKHAKEDSEKYLGDGLLGHLSSDTRFKPVPVQETKVNGFDLKGRSIEEKAVEVMDKKIAKRKNGDYADDCILMVSVLSPVSNIDYQHIVATCDINVFDRAYLIEYIGNPMRRGAMHDLKAIKNSKPPYIVKIIEPRLVYLEDNKDD